MTRWNEGAGFAVMDLDAFIKARPVLYHLTTRENLPLIQSERKLWLASYIYGMADMPDRPRQRRRKSELILERFRISA